ASAIPGAPGGNHTWSAKSRCSVGYASPTWPFPGFDSLFSGFSLVFAFFSIVMLIIKAQITAGKGICCTAPMQRTGCYFSPRG
ncbi:MAG: hypothetical protein AB7K04_12625, partial [Pseudorhodoplanes sp.]